MKRLLMPRDELQAAMAIWAARDLPARLSAAETGKLLGFAEHDIQILMAVGKLTPLGESDAATGSAFLDLTLPAGTWDVIVATAGL